jgi:hypothetical protein
MRAVLVTRVVPVLGLLAILAVVVASRAAPAHAATALVNNFPSRYFAPYVDMTAFPTQSLVSDSQNGGLKFYTLAFVQNDQNLGCTAAWGGVVPLNQLSTFLPNLDSDIQSVRSRGGDVIVSFGGAAGQELAEGCSSQSALQAQYQSIIDHYQASHLDFDIEGIAVTETASIDLRNRTLAALQAANPGLTISYTLPVLPTGLVDTGLNVLRSAVANGVNVGVVNIMAMDYGPSFSANMGQNAVDAANSLFTQLKGIFPGRSDAQIRSMIGVTPMSGANDVAGETFTLADAQQVLGYAQQNGIKELAMWSVNRDEPAFSYSGVFNQFNGAGPPPTPPPPTPTPRPSPTPTQRPPSPSPTPTQPPPPPPTGGNLVANPGFESGGLAPWSCSTLDSVVSSPVHTGGRALSAAANNSDFAQCTQAISVQPNHSYKLSAFVQGSYAFIGVTGTGTSDVNTFSPSAPGFTQLSVSFTTGAGTTSVTVFVHGWYAQGTIFADDLSVT